MAKGYKPLISAILIMRPSQNPEVRYNFSAEDKIYGGSTFAGFSTLFEISVTIGHEPNFGMAIGALGILFGGYFVYKGTVDFIGEKYIPLLIG